MMPYSQRFKAAVVCCESVHACPIAHLSLADKEQAIERLSGGRVKSIGELIAGRAFPSRNAQVFLGGKSRRALKTFIFKGSGWHGACTSIGRRSGAMKEPRPCG